MRVDERRREHETASVDDAVAVRVDSADCGDRAAVDPNVDEPVDPFRRIEDARAADHEVVADAANALIIDQVRAGLVTRMAVLYDLLTHGPVLVESAVAEEVA